MSNSGYCSEKRYSKPFTYKVEQFQCKDKMYFKSVDYNATYYGFEFPVNSLQNKILELKNDSTWVMLGKE